MSRPTPTLPRKPTRGSRPSAMNWLTTFCGSAAGCASASFHQILLDVQYAAILHFGAAPCNQFFAGTSVTGRKPICVGCCPPSLNREALEECGTQKDRGRKADKGGAPWCLGGPAPRPTARDRTALAGGRGYRRAHVRHNTSAAACRLAVIAWREELGCRPAHLNFRTGQVHILPCQATINLAVPHRGTGATSAAV